MNLTKLIRKNSKVIIIFTLSTFVIATLFGLFVSYASLFQ
jgi:hypothetical protein